MLRDLAFELEHRRELFQELKLFHDQGAMAQLGFALEPKNFWTGLVQKWDQVHSLSLKDPKLFRRNPVFLDANQDPSRFRRNRLDYHNCFLPQCKLHPNNY